MTDKKRARLSLSRLLLLLGFVTLSLIAVLLFYINDLLASQKESIRSFLAKNAGLDFGYEDLSLVGFPSTQLRMSGLSFLPPDCSYPIRAQQVDISFGLERILHGEINIYSARLYRPQVAIASTGGALHLKGCKPRKVERADTSSLLGVSIDKLHIESGSFELQPGLRVSEVNLDVEVREDFVLSAQIGAIELRQPEMKLQNVTLEKLVFTPKKLLQGKLSLGKSFVVDGADRYELSSLDFEFSAKPDWNIRAASRIEGFGFDDGTTSISDVNGLLQNINVQVSPSYDVEVHLDLHGDSIQLEHESVAIHGIGSLSSPVTVKVPSAGGYLVEGKASIDEGHLTTLQREFQGLSGIVPFSISGREKSIVTDGTRFLLGSTPGQLKTKFLMERQRYRISDTVIEVGQGQLGGQLTLGRQAPKPIEARVKMTQIELGALLPEGKTNSGVVDRLEIALEGNQQNLQTSLVGEGSVRVSKVSIRRVNLAQRTFNALKKLPPLRRLTTPKENTVTEYFECRLVVGDARVACHEALLKHRHFTLQGEGAYGFDRTVDAEADVILIKETAQSLGLGVKSLERLFGSVLKLRIPIKVSGKPEELDIRVDKGKLSKRALGLELLQGLMEKAGS